MVNNMQQIDAKLLKKGKIRKQQKQPVISFGNKIAVKITKRSRTSPRNNSETVTNEHGKEIPKERSTSPDRKLLMILD